MSKSKEEVREELKKKKDFTDTTTFLLPCLGMSLEELLKLGFVNCYLLDKNREKINEKDVPLYLLFHPDEKQLIKLSTKIELLEEEDPIHSVYLEDYDYEGGYVILVLKFPTRFKKDYNRFLKGRYSLFSDEFKDYYVKEKEVEFINQRDEVEKLAGKSKAWMIVSKDEKWKKYQESKYDISLEDCFEYYHLYKIEDETLDIDLLK